MLSYTKRKVNNITLEIIQDLLLYKTMSVKHKHSTQTEITIENISQGQRNRGGGGGSAVKPKFDQWV